MERKKKAELAVAQRINQPAPPQLAVGSPTASFTAVPFHGKKKKQNLSPKRRRCGREKAKKNSQASPWERAGLWATGHEPSIVQAVARSQHPLSHFLARGPTIVQALIIANRDDMLLMMIRFF